MAHTTPAAKWRIMQLGELRQLSDTCTTFKKCHSCISHSSWSKERCRRTRFHPFSRLAVTSDSPRWQDDKPYEVFTSPLSCCFGFIFLLVLKVFSPRFVFVCLFFFGQALRSQNALHRESDWRQSVRLQASTEEDLPEEKAHQEVLNSWAFLICSPALQVRFTAASAETFETLSHFNKKLL